MKKKLKWGIIGFGNASEQFVKCLKNNNTHEIEILSSVSKREFLYKKINFIGNISDSYLDVIKSSKVDIVFIGLTNELHYEYSKLALQNNKHVVIEKPACINEKQFFDLLTIAKKNNLKIFEAIYFRSNPNIDNIFNILKQNDFFRIKKIFSEFGNDALGGRKIFGIRLKKPNAKKRLFSTKQFGGAIWDLGCYPIAFVNLFLKNFVGEYLSNIKIVDKKKIIGSTGVDMESELILKQNNIDIKLKSSLINNLSNSIKIEFVEGKVEILNLMNFDNDIIIKLNLENKVLEFKLNNNKNIIECFLDKISSTLNKNIENFDFPLVTNFETLENIKIMNKWRN